MTQTILTTALTVTQTMDGNDQYLVTATGSVITANSQAFSITGDNNDVYIDGLVATTSFTSIRISGLDSSVVISQNGQVYQTQNGDSSAALSFGTLAGNSTMTNHGQITGTSGLSFESSVGGNVYLNYGTVTSLGTETDFASGILFYLGDGTFYNYGIVSARQNGIYVRDNMIDNVVINEGSITGDQGILLELGSSLSFTNAGTLTALSGIAVLDTGAGSEYNNSGEINGDIDAVAVSGLTQITNSGVIDGDVLLGTGADTYLGRADGVVTGEINGGAGDDRLVGGANVDTMYGGDDIDSMRGRDGDDDLNGGDGRDDIRGQGGDDYIAGDGDSDTLMGGRGDDEIDGGAGNDTITGGRGNDILTGGTGRDVFVFNRATGDDEITDFLNNIDRIDLSAYGLTSRQDLTDAGAIIANGSGSIIDLTLIGGDGVIYVEDMTVAQWSNHDFVF